jgi:hypothetical protein
LVDIPSVVLFDGFDSHVDSFKELVKMLAKTFRTFILGVIEDGDEGTQFGRNQLFGATSLSNDFVASIKESKMILDVLGFFAIGLGSGRGLSISRTNASGNCECNSSSVVGGGWSGIVTTKSSRDIVEGRIPLDESSFSVIDIEFLGGLVSRMDVRKNCC